MLVCSASCNPEQRGVVLQKAKSLQSVGAHALVTLMCCCLTDTLVAQGADEDRSDNKSDPQRIEEILVTAQKREESLQKVPVAVTVFSEKVLESSRIQGITDVASRTPGFVIATQGPHSPELTIRGIGSTDREAASDRSVVLFVDDVYIGRTGGSNIDLFDLERIEVLRGPQGTLYGKNVVGGLVNVITKKPAADPYAKVQMGFGNYDYFEARGVVNSPLSDNLFGKIAFSTRNRDGTSINELSGHRIDGFDSSSLRGQLRYAGIEDADFLLSAEYTQDRISGISSRISPAGPFVAQVGYVPDPDLYVVANNIDGLLDREIYGVTGRADVTTGLGVVTSLTSVRRLKFRMERDATGVPLRGGVPGQNLGWQANNLEDEKDDLVSQEIRLASDPDVTGPLIWVTGLYYMNEHTSKDLVIDGVLAQPGRVPTVSAPLFEQSNRTNSYAAFGQATWSVTGRLNLTAGGRYTIDEKDFSLQVTNSAPARTNSLSPALAEFATEGSDRWSAFTPKVSVDFALADEHLLYAVMSRGFKSGGRGGLAGNRAAAERRFEPEYAWNYEIGSKSRFMDDRVQLNLSGFFEDFKDLQSREVIELVPGDQSTRTAVIFNAAKADIKGAELELLTTPVRGLTLSATYAYLDTEITESVNPLYTGKRLPRAPRNSYSVSGAYTFLPWGDLGSFTVRTDYRYQGELFFDLGEVPTGREPGYGLLDGSIGFESGDGTWEVSLWGKNILDERYRSHAQSCCGGTAISRIGDPDTYGINVTWHHR